MSIKRYNGCFIPDPEGSGGIVEVLEPMVAAKDYDALAERLAEAERLLAHAGEPIKALPLTQGFTITTIGGPTQWRKDYDKWLSAGSQP